MTFFALVWVGGYYLFDRVWVGMGECNLFLAGCGLVWVSVIFFGWMLAGVGECGSLWVSVTFFRLGWMSVGEYEWVWLDVGECTVYNYPYIIYNL